MKIAAEQVEIPKEKITGYLLVHKEKNDKSAFLSKLGYSIENWEELANDISNLVIKNEAFLQSRSTFGDMYEVHGNLKGVGIVTIWLLAVGTEKFRFITLYPN